MLGRILVILLFMVFMAIGGFGGVVTGIVTITVFQTLFFVSLFALAIAIIYSLKEKESVPPWRSNRRL